MVQDEQRLMKLARREGKTEKKKKNEVDEKAPIIAEGSNTSSNLSRGVRRTALRAELKDKYSDILSNQPQVVLMDLCDEYFQGHFGSFTQKFFERCIKQPKVVLDPNPKLEPF